MAGIFFSRHVALVMMDVQTLYRIELMLGPTRIVIEIPVVLRDGELDALKDARGDWKRRDLVDPERRKLFAGAALDLDQGEMTIAERDARDH